LGEKYLPNKLDAEGRIFNIQKFSIHDGPGIRTSVFLKGCPLRCPWCSNPESINPYPEIITKFDLCIHCNQCLEVCAREAIAVSEETEPADNQADNEIIPIIDQRKKSVRTLDRDKCDRCMKCVETCPSGALSSVGETRTVQEIIDVVEQDMPFYKTSGGGVTLTGGEPMFQPEFALAILKESKRRGIHTAIDTCGKTAPEVIKSLLPYLDLVLYDVKHIDPQAHIEATGSDNGIILDNLQYLNGRVDIWLRVPLIPGFNDDEKTIFKILELAGKLSIEKLFFLPYHQWGLVKYSGLGRKYPLSDAEPIPDEKLETIGRLSRSMGIGNIEIASE